MTVKYTGFSIGNQAGSDKVHSIILPNFPAILILFIEITAILFSVLSVLFARNNHILLYPTGLISTSLYTMIMWRVGLYAESLLNLYYFSMSLYGWFLWYRRKGGQIRPIRLTDRNEWLIALGISIGTFLLLAPFFRILQSIIPGLNTIELLFWDRWVTGFAFGGMWLLAKRKVSNWLFLTVSNAIAIPLQFHKEMYFTAGLTCFLLIAGISGYFKWRKYVQSALS